MSKYEDDILHQLTRIADSLEKIERKLPEPPILTANEMREKVGLGSVCFTEPVKSCGNCAYLEIPDHKNPCYSCRGYSNWVSEER